MRTTLNLDDDVLAAARDLARMQRRPLGEVVSALARQTLSANGVRPDGRNGIALLPRAVGATTVTLTLVNRLRDQSS